MSAWARDNRRTAKRLLVTLMLVALGAVAAVFFEYQRRQGDVGEPGAELRSEADMAIGRVQQTATRDGRIEWRVDAGSAEYSDAAGEVRLNDLAVTFFLADGDRCRVTADQGRIGTQTNDLDVSGQVVVTQHFWRMESTDLAYRNRRREFSTTTGVRLSGPRLTITAERMTFNLDTQRAFLEGRVEGIFSENKLL